MTYSEEEIKRLADLVSFIDDTDLHQALAEQNKALASEITKFHIEVVMLKGIQELSRELGRNPRYLELRDFMKEKIFKGEAGNVALEEKMDEVLPILQKKKLMTKKMGITKLGRIAVAAKETASHSNKDRKTIH